MGMTRAKANHLGGRRGGFVPHVGTSGIVAASLLIVFATSDARARSHPPLKSKKGIVAADNETAARVGAQVLADGGNAADAAAATALALGVVHPGSSGLGGGGFAVVYVAAENKVYVLDFREVAPGDLTPDKFERDGKVDESLSLRGGLAVAVPGEVAGLETLVKRFGQRSFAKAVKPAENLARKGFTVGEFLVDQAAYWSAQNLEDPWFSTWLPKVKRRAKVKRPKLAKTLAAIRAKGARGFYRGWVAKDIAAAVTDRGGVMTTADLRGYKVVEREPLWGNWRGKKVATMPLPSSGGLIVLASLGILEASGLDLADLGAGSSAYLHVLAEVFKHTFADRARFLGDVGHATVTNEDFLAPKRLRELAKRINPLSIGKHAEYGDSKLGQPGNIKDDRGTSHVCVIDADGNAVALTTTVNFGFGAKLVAPKSGVVLNNEVDDFSLYDGAVNAFGLQQGAANVVGPGKRPLSSMSPTLVFEDDKVVACLGGSGGPRIIVNVVQVLLNVYVHGMDVREAIEAPRIHHQWNPDKLLVEDGIARDVQSLLRVRGHTVVDMGRSTSSIQAIIVRDDGTREAASDPRKMGAPAAEDSL